jgi:hypothetical protein
MNMTTRGISVALSLGAVALVAACSSSNSTGPTPPTAAAEALHIDSLWAVADLADMTDNTYNSRVFALNTAEYALAYGARPSFFSVSVSGAKQTWTGVSLLIESGGDTEAVQILWDDANADNMFVGGFIHDVGVDSIAEFIASDTLAFDASTGSILVTPVSEGTSGTCTLQSGLQNTGLSNIFGSDMAECASLLMSSTVNVTSTVPAGAEAGLASFSYSTSNATGEFFYDVTDPARVPPHSPAANKIRALLQQLHAHARQ